MYKSREINLLGRGRYLASGRGNRVSIHDHNSNKDRQPEEQQAQCQGMGSGIIADISKGENQRDDESEEKPDDVEDLWIDSLSTLSSEDEGQIREQIFCEIDVLWSRGPCRHLAKWTE